jgi:hypothetical protein
MVVSTNTWFVDIATKKVPLKIVFAFVESATDMCGYSKEKPWKIWSYVVVMERMSMGIPSMDHMHQQCELSLNGLSLLIVLKEAYIPQESMSHWSIRERVQIPLSRSSPYINRCCLGNPYFWRIYGGRMIGTGPSAIRRLNLMNFTFRRRWIYIPRKIVKIKGKIILGKALI